MARKRSRIFVFVASAAVVGAAAGAYLWQSSRGPDQVSTLAVVPVVRGVVSPTLTATGFVESSDERDVNPRVSGKVEEILVKVGDAVVAGQRLFRLDDESAQRQVRIASASLKSAKLRLGELKDQSATDSQIAEAEVAVARAGADQASALAALDETVAKSPIKGTVLSVVANAGDYVSAGAAGGLEASGAASGSSGSGLVTVADLGNLRISASIDQADISKISVGRSAKISLDAIPDKRFSGHIVSVGPVPERNQNVVTYTAYVSFDTLDSALRLGMSVDIEVDLGKKENVLTVPSGAVRTQDGRKIVTKMEGGTPTVVPVETGLIDTERTEIVKGLTDGDRVALRPIAQENPTSTPGSRGGPFGPPGGFGGPPPGGARGLRGGP